MMFNLFGKHTKQHVEEDRIISYAADLLPKEYIPRIILEKWKVYQQIPDEKRAVAGIPLYIALEDAILAAKPPLTKQEYNKQSLRAEIQSHIQFEQLAPQTKILFAPPLHQRLYVYEVCLKNIVAYMLRTVGQSRVAYIVATAVKDTPFQSVKVTADGLSMKDLYTSPDTIDQTKLTQVFKNIYRMLYEEIYILFGEVSSLEVLTASFSSIKNTYDTTMTSYLFEIIPEGTLENEKLAFMSREALEQQVLQRTRQIEETKQHLEEMVVQRTRELEEAKQHVETILKSIGDAVFAVDLSGKIILMNKIAEEMTGFSFAEANGKHYTQIFRFTSEQEPNIPYFPFVEKVMQEGAIQQLKSNTQIVKKDGTHIPISDSAAPIKDKDGKILGCVVVFRNASSERELERTKDTFLSIAAHQLRTPLGAIRWNLEMLLSGDMGEVSDPVKTVIEQMYENDKRLIVLVNDLLNVSRIDQKRVVYQPMMVDILAIIQEALADLEREANKKGVHIQVEHDPQETYTLYLDKKHFREAMENLISNAVKYSFAGGKVVVKVEKISLFIQISIIDHGIGIPQKDKSSIFTKFFRAENALKSATEGSGLGLFVVKSFVESLGGSVSFDSQEGRGTTFYIKLPLSGQ